MSFSSFYTTNMFIWFEIIKLLQKNIKKVNVNSPCSRESFLLYLNVADKEYNRACLEQLFIIISRIK